MTAQELHRERAKAALGYNYDAVRTSAQLGGRIRMACDALDGLGFEEKAAEWREKLKGKPERMGKEAINCVLLSAYRELEKMGVI